MRDKQIDGPTTAPDFRIEEGDKFLWIHVEFGELLRIVHVSQEVIFDPHLPHHVVVGVLQSNPLELKNPRDHHLIPIFDSRNHGRTSANYKYIDVGFHSHNVKPSMIASEVMLTIFFQYEGEGDGGLLELSTFQLITLGKLHRVHEIRQKQNRLSDFS